MNNQSASVLIVMGSDSDFDCVSKAFSVFDEFEIGYDVRIASAHRTPEIAIELAKGARDQGYKVIICAAGMAAHLAGVFAANSTLPVIGVPLSGGVMDGVDALLSTVQMPSGFPVATVAVNGTKNAAYLAISILSLSDKDINDKLNKYRQLIKEQVIEKDKALTSKLK